jgi:hypothetical protein
MQFHNSILIYNTNHFLGENTPNFKDNLLASKNYVLHCVSFPSIHNFARTSAVSLSEFGENPAT